MLRHRGHTLTRLEKVGKQERKEEKEQFGNEQLRVEKGWGKFQF